MKKKELVVKRKIEGSVNNNTRLYNTRTKKEEVTNDDDPLSIEES